MTNSYLYRHAVTGIEGTLSESFARALGDALVRVEPEAKRSPRLKAATAPVAETVETPADTTTESSKEGNK